MINKDFFKNINDHFLFNIINSLMRDKKTAANFNKEFAAVMPDIENEILTYSIDENCSCREKIKAYAIVYKAELIDFIINFTTKHSLSEYIVVLYDKLKEEFEKQGQLIVEATEEGMPLSVSGKIAKTTITDWKQFADEIKNLNLHYKAFSVVKEKDELLVFFL